MKTLIFEFSLFQLLHVPLLKSTSLCKRLSHFDRQASHLEKWQIGTAGWIFEDIQVKLLIFTTTCCILVYWLLPCCSPTHTVGLYGYSDTCHSKAS